MPETADAETRPRAEWFEGEVLELLPELLSTARRMADTSADAEDLVADAVARAWEKLDDLRDPDRFRGWIFCILRTCFLGRRRRRKARPQTVPFREEGEAEPSFSLFERLHQPFLLWWGGGEEEFLDGLLKEDLEAAIDDLPEDFRTVVVLADVHGFKYREIADALDIPVGTVRSRLARARSRMQQALWSHAVDRGLRDPKSPSSENSE